MHKESIKKIKFFDRKDLFKKINPNNVVDYKVATMDSELCDKTMKMVKEVMVLDVSPLSHGIKNRLNSYKLPDSDIGVIHVTNHVDKYYTSNKFTAPGTLQTFEPKTYPMTSMNGESIHAMKDGPNSMKKNVCGKSTSNDVLNLVLDICKEKEFQGKYIGLNAIPKVFSNIFLETQKKKEQLNENSQNQF